MDMPVPEGLETATDDVEQIATLDKHIVWKLKSEAARITFRLFMRFANGAKYASNNEEDK